MFFIVIFSFYLLWAESECRLDDLRRTMTDWEGWQESQINTFGLYTLMIKMVMMMMMTVYSCVYLLKKQKTKQKQQNDWPIKLWKVSVRATQAFEHAPLMQDVSALVEEQFAWNASIRCSVTKLFITIKSTPLIDNALCVHAKIRFGIQSFCVFFLQISK